MPIAKSYSIAGYIELQQEYEDHLPMQEIEDHI